MAKRVTIVIDLAIDKKIRDKQAEIIAKTKSGCSYSKVLNDTLRKVL